MFFLGHCLRIMAPEYFRPNFIYLKISHFTKNNFGIWSWKNYYIRIKKEIEATQMFNLRKFVKYKILLLNVMLSTAFQCNHWKCFGRICKCMDFVKWRETGRSKLLNSKHHKFFKSTYIQNKYQCLIFGIYCDFLNICISKMNRF